MSKFSLRGMEAADLSSCSVKPGGRRQEGKLVGLSRQEIVVELENGLRVHFPRIGFVMTKA